MARTWRYGASPPMGWLSGRLHAAAFRTLCFGCCSVRSTILRDATGEHLARTAAFEAINVSRLAGPPPNNLHRRRVSPVRLVGDAPTGAMEYGRTADDRSPRAAPRRVREQDARSSVGASGWFIGPCLMAADEGTIAAAHVIGGRGEGRGPRQPFRPRPAMSSAVRVDRFPGEGGACEGRSQSPAAWRRRGSDAR